MVLSLQLYGPIFIVVWSHHNTCMVPSLRMYGPIITVVWSHYYSCVVLLLQLYGPIITFVWSNHFSCMVQSLQVCGPIITVAWYYLPSEPLRRTPASLPSSYWTTHCPPKMGPYLLLHNCFADGNKPRVWAYYKEE